MKPKSMIGKKIAAIAKVAGETSQKAGAAAGKQLDAAKKTAGKKVAKVKKDWREMDPKKKKRVIAGGILAVAAAIAIPIAVKRARAKKSAKAS